MVKEYLNIGRVRILLTQSGFVALDCEDLGAPENDFLFGNDGIRPPVSLSRLVCDLLAVYAAAPEDGDAAALRGLVAGLQESLGEVRAALAKVEHC